MRLAKGGNQPSAEGDMTPMIDMTFQLIAFFMILINFSEVDQDQRIKLPMSELAKPPDTTFEEPITLQLTKDNTVLYGGDEVPVTGLRPLLMREKTVIERTKKKAASVVTVIIRADSTSKTGEVQEIIQACQETGFEKFALRAQQEER